MSRVADMEKRLSSYPDVSFIDGMSFADLEAQMIQDYENRYFELTGKEVSLAPADPYRLILMACAVAIYQGYQYEDRAGKMGLLKYSTGEYLDNLAALKGVKRNEAVPAQTTIRFTLSTALEKTAKIPKGTRLKGLDLYFETDEDGEIPVGEMYTDIPASCQTAGTVGNGLNIGTVRTLVDPLPYNLTAENITESSGGADRETDEELAQRVYIAPEGYSTAGPGKAYEYWVKTFSQAITECRITSEKAGEVDIYITENGEIPEEDFLQSVTEYLKNSSIRPLTDYVVVKAPETVSYEIEFTYYISSANRDMEETIKAAVETACQNYISWQKEIGKNITPSQLVYLVMAAGAQSVEVKKPAYMVLQDSQLAAAQEPVIHYGGLRDD